MANPLRRGESGSQVTTWAQNDNYTPNGFTSSILPYGLQLRQTINAGTTSVTIPSGITWVYAIAVGGGAGGYFGYGGRGGEVSWGWALANSTCIVGSGGTNGNSGGYTRYGHIIAKGGPIGSSITNYFGQPAGASFGDNTSTNGGVGANGGGGGGATTGSALPGGNGGNGISGGGGGQGSASTGTSTGGNGGSGLVGGGAGKGGGTTTASRVGGNGGNGINILTGAITTGGTGQTNTGADGAGGGGAGVAGNGQSGALGGAGGLGGGGAGSASGNGGDGILYIFY